MLALKNSERYEIYCNSKRNLSENILLAAHQAVTALDINNFIVSPNVISKIEHWPHCKCSLLIEPFFNTHPDYGFLRLTKDYLERFQHMNYVEVPLWLDDVINDNTDAIAKFLEKTLTLCSKYQTIPRVTYPVSFIENHELWFNMLDSVGITHVALYKKLVPFEDISALMDWKNSVSSIKCSVMGGFKDIKPAKIFDLGIYSLIMTGKQYMSKSV